MRLTIALLLLASASPALAQDRDADGIPDAADLCPDRREGDGVVFPGDGCPDADGDQDHVVDDYDVCPDAAENVNGIDDADGCVDARPATAPVDLAPFVGRWTTTLGITISIHSDEHHHSRGVAIGAAAPAWLGAAGAQYECYAARRIDDRAALHCRTQPSTRREITIAIRRDGDRLIGVASARSAAGIDRAAFSATLGTDFDQQDVVGMIQASRDAIQGCYEAELRSDHALAGRVAVQLTIQPSGQVDGVHVTSDSLAPPRPGVGACIVAVIDAWVFSLAPIGGSITYTFPFVFEPQPSP